MSRTTGLLLVLMKSNVAAAEAEWGAWYDKVLMPAMLRDGPWAGTRWEVWPKPAPGMPGVGFTHVSMLEFDGDHPANDARAFLARAPQRGVPMNPHHAVVSLQIATAHGRHVDKTSPTPELRGQILAWVFCNQPAVEAEWDAWYDREHVPDMMESGAFTALTRWKLDPRPHFGPTHLTIYDTPLDTIEEAVERSAQSLAKLTAAGRKHRCHTGGMSVTLRRAKPQV